jgi:hypothetical protein
MRNIIFLTLTLIGFGGTFLFTQFKAPPYSLDCSDPELKCANYILCRPDIKFDRYTHVYYVAERVFIALIYFCVWFYVRNFSTFVCFILFTFYALDYLVFFNDPAPGIPVSFAMLMGGTIFILLIYEVKEWVYGNS